MAGGRKGVPSSRISDMIGGNDQGNNSLFAQAGRLMAGRVMPAIGKAIAGADNALLNMDTRGLASGITMAGAAVTGVTESIRTKYRSPTKAWENRTFKGHTYMLEGRKAQPLALEGSSSQKPRLLMGGVSPSDAPPPLCDAVYMAFTPLAPEKFGEMKQIWDASSRGVTETQCSKPLPVLELEYTAKEAAQAAPAVEEKPQETAAAEGEDQEETVQEASGANEPKEEELPEPAAPDVADAAEEDAAEDAAEEDTAEDATEDATAEEEAPHASNNTQSSVPEATEEASAVAKAVAMLEAATRSDGEMTSPLTPEKMVVGHSCRVTRGGMPITA